MSIITARNLTELGFNRVYDTSNPNEPDFHYYTYEINDKCLLISCANDETINDGYSVEFYEFIGLKFIDLDNLKQLMNILNAAKNE